MNNPIAVAGVVCAGLLVAIWILKKPVRGLYLSILLVPVLSGLETPVLGFRMTLFDLVIGVTFIGWLLRLLLRKGIEPRGIKVQFFVPLILFYFACTLSLFHTLSYQLSVVELFTYMYLGLLLFLFGQLVRSQEQFHTIIFLWLVAGAGVIFVGFLQAVKVSVSDGFLLGFEGAKVSSTFRRSGQLPSYLVTVLPLLLMLSVQKQRHILVRTMALFVVFLGIIVMAATGSRTGVIITLFVLFSFAVWHWRRLGVWKTYLAIGVLFLSLAIMLGSWQDVPFAVKRSLSILGIESGYQDQSPLLHRAKQFEGWTVAVEEYPIIGFGVGDSYDYMPQLVPSLTGARDAHNTYLGVWAETGLLGFLSFMSFLTLVVIEAKKVAFNLNSPHGELGRALVIALLGMLLYGMGHFGLRQRHLWLLIAMVLSIRDVLQTRQIASQDHGGQP